MILEPYDGYLDDHHPACRGGCGQLADECMCAWPQEYWYTDTIAVVVHDEPWFSDDS